MPISFNWLILNQFRLNLRSTNIPEPKVFRNFQKEREVAAESNGESVVDGAKQELKLT